MACKIRIDGRGWVAGTFLGWHHYVARFPGHVPPRACAVETADGTVWWVDVSCLRGV